MREVARFGTSFSLKRSCDLKVFAFIDPVVQWLKRKAEAIGSFGKKAEILEPDLPKQPGDHIKIARKDTEGKFIVEKMVYTFDKGKISIGLPESHADMAVDEVEEMPLHFEMWLRMKRREYRSPVWSKFGPRGKNKFGPISPTIRTFAKKMVIPSAVSSMQKKIENA